MKPFETYNVESTRFLNNAGAEYATEWQDKPDDKKWETVASAEAGAAGNLGIGAEGKIKFGYEKGHVRFTCALQAVFIVGGKGSWDIDLGIVATLDFLAELARRVDYHYVAEIAGDLYEALGAYKYALLITPPGQMLVGGLYTLKEIDHSVDVARDFVHKSREMFQKVTMFADGKVKDTGFVVSKQELEYIISQVEKIHQSPPEAIARFIMVAMKTVEPSSYIYITKILEAAESDHEVRWVIRHIGLLVHLYELHEEHKGATTISYMGVKLNVKNDVVFASNEQIRAIMDTSSKKDGDKQKNHELKDGVSMLLEFGNYRKDNEAKVYITHLTTIFRKNGISYA